MAALLRDPRVHPIALTLIAGLMQNDVRASKFGRIQIDVIGLNSFFHVAVSIKTGDVRTNIQAGPAINLGDASTLALLNNSLPGLEPLWVLQLKKGSHLWGLAMSTSLSRAKKR